MGTDRTTAAETPAAKPAIRRRDTDTRSGGVDGDSVRAGQRRALEHAAARDGLRLGDDVLATAGPLATGRRVEAIARGAFDGIAPPRPAGSRPSRGRQL